MAVAQDGSFRGYLSGGCAETAIAAEAVRAIATKKNFATRFGVGSPYLDIQLPCGAGIDIWFDHTITAALIDNVLQSVERRQPVCVETCVDPLAGPAKIISPDSNTKAGSFRRWYYPDRRIYIVGTGPSVPALARLAIAANNELVVLSPDDRTLEELSALPVHATRLTSISQIQALDRDPFTALVLLFHEHERETEILKSFIHSDVYYIGALGSKRTQAIRLELLRAAGIEDEYVERIHGPVGLDIRSQTPEEIAISILAQMTSVYRTLEKPLIEWSGGALPVIDRAKGAF
jgi:xanthine dehydrogenase accessory factor